MMNIEIQIDNKTLKGKWNEKFYKSNQSKKYKRIYLNNDDECLEIHLTKKQYLSVFDKKEYLEYLKDVEIRLKIHKLYTKLTQKGKGKCFDDLCSESTTKELNEAINPKWNL